MTIVHQSYDPLYGKALALVTKTTNHICVAGIQRALVIGHNRAAGLMEDMIRNHVIERYDTEYGGVGYRLVKLTKE